MHEKISSLIFEAEKYYKTADHLTYVSYPIINEIKLLINIAQNLNNSLRKAMEAILLYERINRDIPVYSSDFESEIEIFRKVANKYNITSEDINFLINLNNIVKQHKISKMEFVRRDKYVICDDNYRMKTLTINDIKEYMLKAKVFILSLRSLE